MPRPVVSSTFAAGRMAAGPRHRPPRRPLRGLPALAAGLAAILAASPVPAQTPPTSREELMHQWDLDRNGTVDATEAEIARSRMRRARNEAARNSSIDPLTGRPRTKVDPVTGRPEQPEAGRGDRRGTPADDDDLILVPGTGDRPARRPRSAADQEDDDSMERPRSADRPALPGTRVPQTGALVPSVRPKDLVPSVPGSSGRGPSSAAAGSTPSAAPPPQPWEQLRGQPRSAAGPGTGIISGGLRGGSSPARPGYGAPTAGTDLNAGRLSAGPPQVRGRSAGGAAAPAPTAGQPNATAGQPTGRTPLIGGSRPLPPRGSATGAASGLRSGMQPPQTTVPQTTVPQAVRPPTIRPSAPRAPGGSPEDFFGR